MDENQATQETNSLERHGDIFKLETPSPEFKEDKKEKNPQIERWKSVISDIASEIYESPDVTIPVAGAMYGLKTKQDFQNAQKYSAKRASDLQIMQDLARKAAAEAKAAEEALSGNFPDQTPSERKIQGARDVSGTTGRARMETFNTETSRRAQAAQGINTPFTKGVWEATDQGVLAPLDPAKELAATKAAENARQVQSMANRRAFIEAAKGPLSTVLDWASKSKLLGAISGATAGIEGYDAYRAFKEGRPLEGLMSGISAAGGAFGTIPHPGAQLAGGALSLAPAIGRKLSEYTYDVFGNPITKEESTFSRPATSRQGLGFRP